MDDQTLGNWRNLEAARMGVNFNQACMAGLMALLMVIIELLVMRSMYADRRLNVVILAACVVGTVGLWFAIREQAMLAEH